MGLAAVPWDRCETYEAGGLGVLETPELGRLDDEHVCGHLADAWNARQDVDPLAQFRVCVAQCFEASIDRCDLAVDLAQPLSELTLDEGRDGDGLTVEGCDTVLDEGVAGVDEFPHGLDRLAGGGARLEVESCAHAGSRRWVILRTKTMNQTPTIPSPRTAKRRSQRIRSLNLSALRARRLL